MKKSRSFFIIATFSLLLFASNGCIKKQVILPPEFPSRLVKKENPVLAPAPGTYAFFNFIQNLGQAKSDDLQTQLHLEAKSFFPDSTLHPQLELFGAELEYNDSIRLLYFEYSRAVPPESHAYLSSFSKTGRRLDVLSIREASYNGNAAVNIIDQQILELEYYDVYDHQGGQHLELAFEHYWVLPNGRFKKLSHAQDISSDRKYLEASTRLLSKDELQRYQPQQLEFMEMELLAEYGMVFKSSRWQRYFDQQQWYTARSSAVEEDLSDLEKVNLDKLRQLQMEW